ncbi:MAG TPA: hypothetical protein VF364_10710, partial [Candidatus Limnocylindria bacterium]
MNRHSGGQAPGPLPPQVEAYFGELKRIDPPDDLMAAVVTEIEAIRPLTRFSWMPATALAAAALVLALYATTSVLPSARDWAGASPSAAPPGTPEESSSPQATPIFMSPPPRGTVPLAGSVEREIQLGDEANPSTFGHGSLWLSSDP